MEKRITKQAYNLISGFYPELTIKKNSIKVLEYGYSQGAINFILVQYGDCEIKLTRQLNSLGICWQYEML